MEIAKISNTSSIEEAASKQIEAAITALIAGNIEVAVTLAGAAEGMIQREGVGLFRHVAERERTTGIDRKQWIAKLNRERDWLKHGGGERTMSFERADGAVMIARAMSKLTRWTPLMIEFDNWVERSLDEF